MIRILTVFILFFLITACAPQRGDFISSNVSESGGKGTKFFQGSKMTGTFSADHQRCTNCTTESTTKETSTKWGTKLIIISDRKIVNNNWVHTGIQNFEFLVIKDNNESIRYIGNAGKNCSEALCNMDIRTVNYKSKNYQIKANSIKEADKIVFNQIKEKEQIAKELKLKQEEEKAKQEKIKKFKVLCSEMGFKEDTETMSNCILQMLTKSSSKVVVTNSDNSSLSEQNRIMEEQTRIMERQLRQQRLENLRESQKTFQKMIDGTCSFC